MGIFDLFTKKKKPEFDLEKELASGKSALDILREVNSGMREGAVAKDVLPKGYGPYGLCATNPIPAEGKADSMAYLSRLRTKDGKRIMAVRNGCTAAKDVTNGMIDIYTLSTDEGEVGVVYLCPYHKKTSSKAPEGFAIL